VARVTPSQGHI